MDTISTDTLAPVTLEPLICKSDGAKTKFVVARNPDSGVIFGKPGRTVHVIPHIVFCDTVTAQLREIFGDALGEPVYDLPKSGSRITIMFPLTRFVGNTIKVVRGDKEVVYSPCIFAINCYDNLVTPRVIIGVFKNASQFSGGTCHFKLRASKHTPTQVSEGVSNIQDLVLTDLLDQWETLTKLFHQHCDIEIHSDADTLIQELSYSHVMLSTQQKEQLTQLWDSLPSRKTWLHKWEAVTYVLRSRIEACMRFGALALK